MRRLRMRPGCFRGRRLSGLGVEDDPSSGTGEAMAWAAAGQQLTSSLEKAGQQIAAALQPKPRAPTVMRIATGPLPSSSAARPTWPWVLGGVLAIASLGGLVWWARR